MNDLPIPVQQGQQNLPITQPSSEQVGTQPGAISGAVDPKDLLERATAQIEQIIASTPSDPSQRSEQAQAVKAAYIKARYNLDVVS